VSLETPEIEGSVTKNKNRRVTFTLPLEFQKQNGNQKLGSGVKLCGWE